jgi:16S rRNA (guanine527-N7)-methyltransferase
LLGVLKRARERGFLGPGPIARQLAHARDLAVAVGPFEGQFLDLGSGGGLPGLALAEAWPHAQGVLLDAQQKRCAFLWESVASLGLEPRLRVVCGRAEVLARDPDLRGHFDLVVARSFAAPAVSAECAVGFLVPGGRLVVTEPPRPEVGAGVAERWPTAGLEQLGFAPPTLIGHGETGAVTLRLVERCGDRWPRREGVPAKRPLWRTASPEQNSRN